MIIKKEIINHNQLKKILKIELQEYILNFSMLMLQTNKFENEKLKLIKNILFLNSLEEEINTNNILKMELQKIENKMEKLRYHELISVWWENGFHYEFVRTYRGEYYSEQFLIHYNKKIKESRNIQIKKNIDTNLKTKSLKKEYKNWKINWFTNLDTKFKNNDEHSFNIDFTNIKTQVNTFDLQNKDSSSQSSSNKSQKI